MNATLKSLLSIIAGIAIGLVVLLIIQWIAILIYPMPPGFDIYDEHQISFASKVTPTGLWLILLLAWFSGAFSASLSSRLIVSNNKTNWIIAGFAMIMATIYMLQAISFQPNWVNILGVLCSFFGIWAGFKLEKRING